MNARQKYNERYKKNDKKYEENSRNRKRITINFNINDKEEKELFEKIEKLRGETPLSTFIKENLKQL